MNAFTTRSLGAALLLSLIACGQPAGPARGSDPLPAAGGPGPATAAGRAVRALSLPSGTTYLSDLTPNWWTNGWGGWEKDRSNGEQVVGDGKPLTIAGQAFSKGLGVHSYSQLDYDLAGSSCTTLSATIGVDDEVGERGSVVFQVSAKMTDGTEDKTLYTSQVLTGTDAGVPITVDVSGAKYLRLKVKNAEDNYDFDHADWADAKLSCAAPPVPTGSQTGTRFPEDPGVIDVTKAPYNADSSGATDATEAIRAAIADNLGKRGFIYFPDGTYRVSKPLWWKNPKGTSASNPEGWWGRLVFRGQSRDRTIIKLDDRAPGFSDPANPTGVIITASENPFSDGGNNQAFQNSVRDLTINTGSGNAGAVGIDYVVSNEGTIKDVKIVSGDGAGQSGIRLVRAYPGPGLIKNVEIQGFDYGVDWGQDAYSMTLEHLTLRNQRVAGIRNLYAQSFIRDLKSVNSVPVLLSTGVYQGRITGPMNTIIGGDFSGGASGNAAIVYGGELVARDLSVSGYGTAIDDRSSANRDVPMSGSPTAVGEFLSSKPRTLFPSPDHTLRLPIEETPEYDPGDPAGWANVTAYGAKPDFSVDSTEGIQAALNSGKPVVWFPGPGTFYRVTRTLTVPASVRLITGPNPIIQGDGAFFADKSSPRPLFRVQGAGAEPVIFEHIEVGPAGGADGMIGLDQASTRTVAWKHSFLGGGWGDGRTPNYINSVTGGKLFLEDVVGSRYQITGPQEVWGRQVNAEYGGAGQPLINISGPGARLWILGIKTENSPEQPLLRVANGAEAEILGLHAYMLTSSATTPLIINDNGRLSISYRQAGVTAYQIAVRETRGSETREERDVYGLIPLYNGYTDK